MADFEPLLLRRRDVDAAVAVADVGEDKHDVVEAAKDNKITPPARPPRVASLDVFRGLSVFLMMLVDYAGSVFPIIAHSPWNGVHLADFVMPFFLFVAGVSLALVYKKVSDRIQASQKVVLRALKLFFLGILLQGGYLHGVTSMTYGVDIERIRILGILQRIAIGYLVVALCEIWLPRRRWRKEGFPGNYLSHWFIVLSLVAIYLGLLYGLYVPDWEFSPANSGAIYEVKCSIRGDLQPGCNSAGMIDRYILGIQHLYQKPVYRNLKECNTDSAPSWCLAPFDPEGILSSLMAAVSCVLGLQFGHILVHFQDHKERLCNWSLLSFSFLALGLFLSSTGIALNKSLYTVSYLLVTSATAGITFCLLYILVDVYGWRRLTCVLEWMGKHALSIFILVTSNIAVIMIQGLYWRAPENNIVHWIITRVVHK